MQIICTKIKENNSFHHMSQLSKKHPLHSVAFCFDVVLSKKEKGLGKKAKSLKATSHDKPPRCHGQATTSKRQGPAGKDVKKIKNSRQEKPLRLFLGLLGRWGSFSSFIFFEIVFLKFQFKK